MANYFTVGKRLPRVDGGIKAAGKAKYTVDMAIPGMLYGKILRSPHPHARLLYIDIGKVERLVGIKGVITGKDTSGIKPGFRVAVKDECALTLDKVRYIGDGVAAVAAVDEDTAEEALDLIRVEYEPLSSVFDMKEAQKEGAPIIHDHSRNNVALIMPMNFGNGEKGFPESEIILEDHFFVSACQNCFMEPDVCLASCEPSGRITLWTPHQSPYFFRKDIAEALGVKEGRIRVARAHVGSGFDTRLEILAHHTSAALLSQKTGRPVKIELSREEMFTINRSGAPMSIYLKTGTRRDGTLMSQHIKIKADSGAYCGRQTTSLLIMGLIPNLPYTLPCVSYEGMLIYTNNSPYGLGHGGGLVQLRFAVEQQIERLIMELRMDPVEFRLKNAIPPGYITANGLKIASSGLTECIQKATQLVQWKERKSGFSSWKGIGIGCCGCSSGAKGILPHDSSSAFVKIAEDGTVVIFTGVPEIGQGSDTALSQIVAEELGVGLEDVSIVSADTELTPMDLGVYGQRGTIVGGNAVKSAATEAKALLLEVASEMLEADQRDLEVGMGKVFVRGSEERNVPISEVVLFSQNKKGGQTIMGKASYDPPCEGINPQSFSGNIGPAYSFNTQVAEVDLDVETGKVGVQRLTIAHDCGFAINPMSVEAQMQGQGLSGIGQTFFEERIMEKGQLLNPSLLDYKLLTSVESPPMDTIIVESIDPYGPFGAKECGSGTTQATSGSLGNAIINILGIGLHCLPLTPDVILDLIEENRVYKGT